MDRIKEYLKKHKNKKTAVAYSGGADSSLLAYAARDFADAVLVKSIFTPGHMILTARDFASRHSIKLVAADIQIPEEILQNPKNRCYLCKKNIYQHIRSLGYQTILDGTNLDDLSEDRPGLAANKEEGIISPFAELGLRKQDIRRILTQVDPEAGQRPSETCLATRVPECTRINAKSLRRIDTAENMLRSLGIGPVRVRDNYPIARIQVRKECIAKLFDSDACEKLKSLGYSHVTVDMEALK